MSCFIIFPCRAAVGGGPTAAGQSGFGWGSAGGGQRSDRRAEGQDPVSRGGWLLDQTVGCWPKKMLTHQEQLRKMQQHRHTCTWAALVQRGRDSSDVLPNDRQVGPAKRRSRRIPCTATSAARPCMRSCTGAQGGAYRCQDGPRLYTWCKPLFDITNHVLVVLLWFIGNLMTSLFVSLLCHPYEFISVTYLPHKAVAEVSKHNEPIGRKSGIQLVRKSIDFRFNCYLNFNWFE